MAQTAKSSFNYEESQVPPYTLPDLLACSDGSRVVTSKEWSNKRRPEILGQFQKEMYGRTPSFACRVRYEITKEDRKALQGKATRKEITIHLTSNQEGPKIQLLLYVPNQLRRPVPAFVGLNFSGNQTIHADPGISLSKVWIQNKGDGKMLLQLASDSTRGSQTVQWSLEKILARGFALATAYYGDIDPDFDDGFQNGVHPLSYKAGQKRPASDEWGAIGAWAWGLSRMLDYLEKDKTIDAHKVAVMGHSRLGKAALWAGVQDQRFAMVISNDSGCGGAALSKRIFGETVERINSSFPHWFCANFRKYSGNEAALPFDQHMLLALVAPRPLYVASAQEDLWADPRGEFLSAKLAGAAYALFGQKGLEVSEMPEIEHPIGERIGYHLRTGRHDVTAYDWEQYLNFAERHLKNKS